MRERHDPERASGSDTTPTSTMTDPNPEIDDDQEEQIRAIAREEAREIYGVEVEDADGESWSLQRLMETFQVDRRTALKALGLIAFGYGATPAVLKAVGTAEAAPTDDMTIPGDLSVGGSVNADSAAINATAGGAEPLATFGAGGTLLGSDIFSLTDDGTETLLATVGQGTVGHIFFTVNSANHYAAVEIGGGSSPVIQSSLGSWSNSDTDGDYCVFVSSGDLVLKNRTGGSENFSLTGVVNQG